MRRRLFPALLIAAILLAFHTPARSAANPGEPGPFYPGASLRFGHLTLDDGLSQNAGLVSLQDSRGYLWFGTQDGLNRYDGTRFTVFKTDPDDPNSISHNSIIALLEDSAGFIWVGTWGGGLDRFDPQTSKFTRYLPDAANPASISHAIVTSLAQDEQGRLWVGTLGGLDLYDPAKGEFSHYRNDPADITTLSSDAVSAILPGNGGKLWVGTGAYTVTGAGLNLFDPDSGKVERIAPKGQCLLTPNISALVADGNGNLWIGTGGYSLPGGGIDRLNTISGSCDHFELGQGTDAALNANNVLDLLLDRDGQLWAATHGDGLVRIDSSNPGKITFYRHDPADLYSLSNDTLFSLYQDRTGMLWVGSLNNGLNKLDLRNLQFRLYERSPEGLTSNLIGGFAETPDGKIWVGTWEAGLERFDRSTGIFEHFPHDANQPDSLASDLVMYILPEADGTLWVGTLGAGLDHFDPKTGKARHYVSDPSDPANLIDNNVVSMVRDGQGYLWVGTMNGLERFDPDSGKFSHYQNDPANPASLSNNATVSFLLDGETLWVGTWGGGLNRLNLADPANLNPKTAQFEIYRHDPKNPLSLGDDGVWAMLKAHDGTIWLATQGGLNRFDPAKGVFKTYREKDGLRNTTVLGVLEDGGGNLWLTTNNGLAKFDPRAEKFTIYDSTDGLQGNEFNSNAAYKSRSGEMFVGGSHGFNIFDPAQIKPNPVAPLVAITGFKIFNKQVDADLSGKTALKLNYDQNFVSFEFAALDFQAPQKNQYAYKLEGFDKDWVEAGTRNYASYTNLPGGDYVLHVRAANSDGTWNEEGVSLPLSVIPPFWLTWQFQAGMALGLIALIAVGVRLRLRSVQAQNKRLEAMVKQQQHVEAELRESEARFKAMFVNSAAGIGLMGLDRRIIDSNPAMCNMLGQTREELIGQTPAMATFPEDYAKSTAQFQQLVRGEIDHYVSERRYVHKSGKVFWASVSMSAVRDDNGKPLYLVGLIMNIDEQKQAQDKLAQQEADYRRTLEQRVEERTYALAEANTRLLDEIEQRTRAENALAAKAADEAVTAERTRLARDLHDAVTQTLFAASLIAEVLPDLWALDVEEAKRSTEELRQLTRGALAEMRTLLLELRPAALTQSRLNDLIRQLCEALIGRARLPINLVMEGERSLPPEVQVAFYRIAQESLNNIFKYARATRVDVSLALSGSGAHLSIQDNGIGFEPGAIKPTSLGMRIMRERAEAIGAELLVSSKPGEGALVEVIWTEKPDMKLSVFKAQAL